MTRIAILLGLYDGARYLQAQLDSFVAQTHADWSLTVSDDGSQDAGPQMVRAFAAAHPEREIRLVDGPRRGFAANFLHLVAGVGPEADLAALSDQDDVWLPHKLARAAAALERAQGPALVAARTWIVGEDLHKIALSPVWPQRPDFGNALVQNITAGNTIVMNRAAIEAMQQILQRMQAAGAGVLAHDWFLYQAITGLGGTVLRDEEPALLYRQHGQNVMGDNGGLRAALSRLGVILSGQFRDWNDRNVAALRAAEDMLTPEARALLDGFDRLRHAGFGTRVAGLARLGVHRQHRLDQAVLWLAALLGKM